ncbi:MAG TPA: hypothetical protein VG345_03130 [Bryobacteraceae bacterium]|nr:hypothetical protein [Bryobacteraceae bacterium]
MRGIVRIAIAIAMVVSLARPFDCFAAMFSRKAATCCAKGKCLPTRSSDDCCKTSTSAGNGITAIKPSSFQTSASFDLTTTAPASPAIQPATQYAMAYIRTTVEPGSPPGSRRNLPLLI